MQRYIEEGIAPGAFLKAVLFNDLADAIAQADWINKPRLAEIVEWVSAHAPYSCWGSVQVVRDWLDHHAAQRPKRRSVRLAIGDERLPVIYVFCSGGQDDWWTMNALSEDGELVAAHVCSDPSFGPLDMGIASDRKHELYTARYPKGFELVWLDDPSKDVGFQAARLKLLAKRRSEE
jgi:hypothetical protein